MWNVSINLLLLTNLFLWPIAIYSYLFGSENISYSKRSSILCSWWFQSYQTNWVHLLCVTIFLYAVQYDNRLKHSIRLENFHSIAIKANFIRNRHEINGNFHAKKVCIIRNRKYVWHVKINKRNIAAKLNSRKNID